MASKANQAGPKRVVPRLYLVTPEVAEPAGFQAPLGNALGAADIAAVLVRLAETDESTLISRIKALAPVVQGRGAALLLDGRDDIAVRSDADGAHLTGIGDFNAALATLKPSRIAGCGGTQTRHDAMLAAEGGADYVMFGEPDEAGQRPSFPAIIERIEWWAEVFEVPCVAYAGSFEEIEPLALAGADFIAVGEWVFADTRGIEAAVRDAARRLVVAETIE